MNQYGKYTIDALQCLIILLQLVVFVLFGRDFAINFKPLKADS